MFKIIIILSIILITNLYSFEISHAELENPEHIKDLHLIQSYFKKRFPDIPFEDFANGVYALDSSARENWEALEDFPPYEMHIDSGEEYWQANSIAYDKCFPNGPAIKQQYPKWDEQLNTIVTVPYAVNLCRQSHALSELDYMGMEMNSLVAYIAYQSRDEIIDVSIPNKEALAAYQQGKKFYFTRRGQLNFACFHCHFDNAGKKLRTESLGPALGQTTGWPTYRNKWGALGPLHRRYIGCNKQVRAAPFEAQSETYRNLEYFHTHMNNGLPINGPAVRR